VYGVLVVEGNLTCLGIEIEIEIEPGGSVTCKALITNVVELDGLRTVARLEAASVRARFAALVQTTCAAVDDGTIDYVHHFAGDLNPSFDYERGERVVEVAGDDLPLQFDLTTIRTALCSGKNPFIGKQPIVTAGAPTVVRAEADPLGDELEAWAAKHPGPQRALFDDMRATWSDRLRGGSAGSAIKKAIGSPKLTEQRGAWIAELGLVQSTPAAAPVVGRDVLNVHVDPAKKSWLAKRSIEVEAIDAIDDGIVEIPPEIAQYAGLKRVQLSYNKITRLPAELCRLPIEHLDVRGNRLTTLPDAIREMTKLSALVLEGNPITALPDALCDLTQLAELSLQDLLIEELPERFGQLAGLR